MTPAEELRLAAARLRDDRNCNGHNVDCRSRELLAMIATLLRTREPLADWLEIEASRWDPEADIQSWDRSHEMALAVARAVLAPPRPGHVQGGAITDRLGFPAIGRP